MIEVERWEESVVASGIGVPQYVAVVVWFRWRCSCGDEGLRVSRPELAEGQGAVHDARNQCSVVGQLALFDLGPDQQNQRKRKVKVQSGRS